MALDASELKYDMMRNETSLADRRKTEDGSRRRNIQVDPVVQLVRDGHVLCEDCWEYSSLQKRSAAVRAVSAEQLEAPTQRDAKAPTQ